MSQRPDHDRHHRAPIDAGQSPELDDSGKWRTPSLEQFGNQLRALERRDDAARGRSAAARRRMSAALVIVPGAAIVATVVTLVLLLTGGAASASSPVQRAPAAAISADTVRFRSIIEVGVGQRVLQRYRQTGEIDFSHGAYRTRLAPVGGEGSVEWRSVDGVLYVGAESSSLGVVPRRVRWVGFRLNKPQRLKLAATPEGDALTDPIALLRVMRDLDAPAVFVGRDVVQGVPAREYEVSSSASGVLRASNPGLAVPGSYRTIASTLNVWLDRAGRPIRVVELLSRASARGPIKLRNTLEFVGYGEPVVIRAPHDARIASSLHGEVPSSLIGKPSRLFQSLSR